MMSNERTWTVVQFLEDDSVEAVPSRWIQGTNKCYWPSSLSNEKVVQAIMKWMPFDEDWKKFEIRIFKNSVFYDFAKAKKKAALALQTSDLDSEVDESKLMSKSGRNIKKKKFASSDDDSEVESILPRPSNIKKFRKAPKEEEDTCQQQQTQKILVMLGDVLSELREMKHEIKELKMGGLARAPEAQANFFKSECDGISFPITNSDDMNIFEELLDNEDKFTKAVDELAKVGGNHAYEFIKRCMSGIISNDQALLYSWLGQKGKMRFKELNTSKLLIKSAEVFGFKNLKEVETSIQLWLRRAFNRRLFMLTKK